MPNRTSDVTRRNFIRSAACATAVPLLSSGLRGSVAVPAEKSAGQAINSAEADSAGSTGPAKKVPAPNEWPAPNLRNGPRLFFTAEQARALKNTAATDEKLRPLWAAFLAGAERLLSEPLVTETEALGGVGQHGRIFLASRQCSETGFALGLAYHATGDRRFAERIRETLQHYGKYRAWIGPGFATRQPHWNSELATASIAFGFATGYDAIAELLSAEERRALRETLVERGLRPLLGDWLLPESRIHALDSMGHNWWSVCISNAAIGALVIADEEPEAQGWLAAAREALAEWFSYSGNMLQNKPVNFDPAGGLYESLNYNEYGVGEYLRFRLAHQNVLGAAPLNDTAWLEDTAGFVLQTLYPTSTKPLSLNFGDSDLLTNFAGEMLRLLLASGFNNPAYRWYLAKTETAVTSSGANLKDVFRLLHSTGPIFSAGPMALPNLQKCATFRGVGWGMFRTSWENDATFLAVKSGYTWNHAHADAGSFVLFHRGEPLLIDSGKCGYDRPEYMSYYVRSRAHNVVLFDGEGQPAEDNVKGVKFSGELTGALDEFGFRYVCADATGPMAHVFSRNYRHWLWIGGVILVIDDLRAHREGRFDWLLHYAGTTETTQEGVRVVNGQSAARVQFLHPKDLERSVDRGMAEGKPDTSQNYLRFSTNAPNREIKIITAILPEEPGMALPEIDFSEGENRLNVRVRQNGKITEVVLNLLADGRTVHLNGINSFSGWTTDAYLLATTRAEQAQEKPSELDSILMIDGSLLRHEGQPVWTSFSKANALFSPKDPTRVAVYGQAGAEVAFSALHRPEQLILNGQPTATLGVATESRVRFRLQ